MKLKKIGNVYHASFRTATGQTKTITTRCTSLGEARKAAADIKDLEQAARSGRLTNEAISHITTGRKITMARAIEQFGQWSALTHSQRTAYTQVKVIEQFVTSQRLHTVPPSAVNEKHIHAFINNPESKIRLGTRNTSLAAVRTFFGFIVAKGWAPADPSKLVSVNHRIIPHRLKEKAEFFPFTKSDIKALLDYESKRIETMAIKRAKIEWGKNLAPAQRRALLTGSPKELIAAESNTLVSKKLSDSWEEIVTSQRAEVWFEEIFWTFAITLSEELALRLGDIAQLEWECFRRPGKIVVWTDKRDRRIEVPISDVMENLLTRVPVNDSTYLFPTQREIILDEKRRALLSTTFLRMCKRVGIKDKSFHGLRHFRISEWKKQGRSLEDIGKDVGHANTKTTEGYVH